MSIPVPLDEIEAVAAGRGHPFLLTTRPNAPTKVLHAASTFVDGAIRCAATPGTIANVNLAGEVVLLWPAIDGGGYALIVDGAASVEDGYVLVMPTSAVLHRPAE